MIPSTDEGDWNTKLDSGSRTVLSGKHLCVALNAEKTFFEMI
jgi:hypothetical protein